MEEVMIRIIDFYKLYQLYRAQHPRKYAAEIAWGIAFKGLPF